MAPSSGNESSAAARGLQLRPRVTRLQSSGGRALNRTATKIVRPPALRKGSTFRRSRRTEEVFAYDSLQRQRLIRLLKLDKRSVTDRRPLGYVLTTVKLSEAPPFYALSYCWGSATRDKDIVCNGSLLSVTAHLKRGIQELQAIPTLVGSWVWIDQISINQDDTAEKSHQVSLMRYIYVQAIRTIVWLGPSNGPCEGGYGLSERLYALCQRQDYSIFNLGWKMPHPKRKLNEELDDCLRLALPRLNSPPWLELDRMLRKSWFSRIWVIQEVHLSKETPILVFGGKARDFNPLLLAGRWIGGTKILPSPQGPAPQPLASFCLQDLHLILSSRLNWSFEALLLHTLDHEASDARDHIFALLGIADPARGRLVLVPDYKSPPWKVFQEATMFMIREMGSLKSLLLVGSTRRTKDDLHPSWVPDYGAKPTLPCPMGVRLRGSQKCIEVTVPWRASSGLPSVTQHGSDGRSLSLDGFEVDQILWTSADITDVSNESLLFRWLEGAAGAVLWSFDSFHNSVDEDLVLTGFFDAFVRVICTAYEDGTYRPSLGDVLEYMDAQEAAEHPREGYFRTMRTHIVSSVLRETVPPAKYCQVSQLVEYFRIRHWEVFLTSRGEFGIARRAGSRGDTVAVIRGGAMPFVLRPVEEKFELVGPCVVLKWMDGLAADMWRRNQISQSRFTLV